MIGKPLCLLLAFLALPLTIQAQERTQTLADIRQDLSVLYYELQRLNRELSTTQAPSGIGSGASVNDRLDAIEAELRRLTGATEKLEFRINQVVKDGTNRVGDLEFRLVELEGGDISTLGETSTLGGDVKQLPVDETPQAETELAVGEEADFAMAQTALEEERFEEAAELCDDVLRIVPEEGVGVVVLLAIPTHELHVTRKILRLVQPLDHFLVDHIEIDWLLHDCIVLWEVIFRRQRLEERRHVTSIGSE